MTSVIRKLKDVASTFKLRDCLIVIIVVSCSSGYLLHMRTVNLWTFDLVFGVFSGSPASSTSLLQPVQQAQRNHNVQNTVSTKPNPAYSLVFGEFYTIPYYHEAIASRHSEKNGRQVSNHNQSISGLTVKTRLILFYNHPNWMSLANCEVGVRQCPTKACRCSVDPARMSEADAVIVDLVDLGDRRPPSRFPNQVWIAFGWESPAHYHTSHHASNGWRRDVFNWTMTYRLDSDVVVPYDVIIRLDDVPKKNFTEIALRKSKSAAWMASNCRTPSRRKEYVKTLQKYYSVDIYGACGPFNCNRDNESECISLLEKTYKFYIAFENSLCKDYITEKLFKTFDIDIVPIVRGGADYSSMIPAGTYINTADFSSPRKLAEHLRYLERNVTAYSEILRRKSQYINSKTAKRPSSLVSAYCDICMKLHNIDNYKNSYHDNVDWLRKDVCSTPKDLS